MNKQKKINLASAGEKVGMPFVLVVLIIVMLINAPNWCTGRLLQACSIHCDVGYDDVYARIGLHDNWWPTYC